MTDTMGIHSFFQHLLPNMQYIQGPALIWSGKRTECSNGWTPLKCQQLYVCYLTSVSLEPCCHLHFEREETDTTQSIKQVAQDHTSTKGQKQHLNFCWYKIPTQVLAEEIKTSSTLQKLIPEPGRKSTDKDHGSKYVCDSAIRKSTCSTLGVEK